MTDTKEWIFKYRDIQTDSKDYKVILENYDGNDNEFTKVRDELDRSLEDFLDNYHYKEMVKMQVQIGDRVYIMSIDDKDEIIIKEQTTPSDPNADPVWLDLKGT